MTRQDEPQSESSPKHIYCLGLGSNIQPAENVPRALELLCQQVTLLALSRAWETPAVGTPGPDFYNAAALVKSSLPPDRLKQEVIRKIEAEIGRVRSADKNAPRPIDIDILTIDNQVLDEDIFRHAYLAIPVAELQPWLISPETGESITEVAQRLGRQVYLKPHPDILPGCYGEAD